MPEPLPTPDTSQTPPVASTGPKGQLFALLAYLPPFLFILTMLKKGDDPFHVAHAKNGAGLFVTALGLLIFTQILSLILPASLWGITNLAISLIDILLLLVMLMGAYKGWKGKEWTIPLITGIGQKIPLEKWFVKVPAPIEAPLPTPSSPTPPAETQMPEPTTAPATPTMEPAAPTRPEAPVASPTAPTSPASPVAVAPATPPTPPPTPPSSPTPTQA